MRLTVWGAAYLVTAGLGLLLALLVHSRGRGSVRRWLTLLLVGCSLALTSSGIPLSTDDPQLAEVALRLSFALAVWMPLLGLGFASELMQRPAPRWCRPLWLLAPAGSAATLLTPWFVAGVRPSPFGFAAAAGPLYPLYLAEVLTAVAQPALLIQAYLAEQRPLERLQLVHLIGASVIGLFALVDLVPPLGLDVPPLGWLPLFTAGIGLFLAVLRHRLLDIQVALRGAFWWLGSTLGGAALFSLLFAELVPVAGRSTLPLALLVGAGVLAMRLWLATAQAHLDRLVGRRRRDLDAEMAHLADSASTLQTNDELGRAVDRFLGALDRRLAALVVIDPTGQPGVAMSAWGAVPAPPRSSPLFAELSAARSILWREQLAASGRVESERACVRWRAEYLVPLLDGQELLGIIAVGFKTNGGPADVLELAALDRMSVTVTAALATTRLYERLRGLHEELERKAEARQVALGLALRDLRGAEQRLMQSEKLAALGQIIGGVAIDLVREVRAVHACVGEVRRYAATVAARVETRVQAEPSLTDASLRETMRDFDPLLDAMGEGGRRALTIAQDLSRFAPAGQAEELPSDPRTATRLDDLIDGTLKLCAGHIKQLKIVRRYQAVPALFVEPGALGQVVLNLVLNATQAMGGVGTLTLALHPCELDGGARVGVELAVTDDGPGIAPEVLPRIFEPFFSTKGGTMGSGLGLSVSYGIIERHGGRIVVESALGIGTTFRVQLPCLE